jgi:cell division initiation protein
MDLTPLDIRNQEFRTKTFGGLDRDEVQAFLTQVAQEFENTKIENTEFSERLKGAREQINHYKLIESSLQEAALTMQKAVDQQKQDAAREAELIIAEARAKAEKDTESIRREAEDLRREILDLRSQRNHFFIRMRSLLQAQQEMLLSLESEEETVSEDLSDAHDFSFRNKRANRKKVDKVLLDLEEES